MGGQIPVDTGYAARIPVHDSNSSDRIYLEVTYLVGIAELAKRGHIRLVTSAELEAEKLRQPIGRFRGYWYHDHSLFEGIDIPSIDGHHFDANEPKAAQQSRLAASETQPFVTLANLLPKKSNLDAWHIHTAHKYRLHCFLVVDFPLITNMGKAERHKDFPKLDTKVMLPSQLGQSIKLRPIHTAAISYEDANWIVRSDLHTPKNKRTPPARLKEQFSQSNEVGMPESQPAGLEGSLVNVLPTVGKVMGANVSFGHDAVGIQYKDKSDRWYQLNMTMGDALYLLSILKSMQLNFDIPFPDDPRDPNAKPIRPSDRENSI
jgi:hypothetical protein